jgi:hypothetical protein
MSPLALGLGRVCVLHHRLLWESVTVRRTTVSPPSRRRLISLPYAPRHRQHLVPVRVCRAASSSSSCTFSPPPEMASWAILTPTNTEDEQGRWHRDPLTINMFKFCSLCQWWVDTGNWLIVCWWFAWDDYILGLGYESPWVFCTRSGMGMGGILYPKSGSITGMGMGLCSWVRVWGVDPRRGILH